MTFKRDHKIYTCEGVKAVSDGGKLSVKLLVVLLSALALYAVVYTVLH